MTDERIIAYLLKELPEEELERFEDECFDQESWPAQLSLVEEDLIDAYLRGELTRERRARFERHYLITEARQELVTIAAALLRHVDARHADAGSTVAAPPTALTWSERVRAFWSSQSWALGTAASLTVVALLAGTVWLSLHRATPPQTFATLTLTISASNNRAEGAQEAGKVKLPLSASALRVSLRLPERLPPAARYRVELENDNGETKSLSVTEQDARSVSVVIPAEQIIRGQYALKLYAIKADSTEQRINGSYFFTVE